MFVTNCISTTKIQKISEITNFFRHYFLSRTEVLLGIFEPKLGIFGLKLATLEPELAILLGILESSFGKLSFFLH